jgi:ubiquitin related modifier 1
LIPCLTCFNPSGGLELLFDNEKQHQVELPATDDLGEPVNVKFLVQWLCKNMMKDPREEMFVLDGSV